MIKTKSNDVNRINDLASEYLLTKSQYTLTDLYVSLRKTYKHGLEKIATSLSCYDVAEIEELYDTSFIKAITLYDGSGKFTNFFRKINRNMRIDFLRKAKNKLTIISLGDVDENKLLDDFSDPGFIYLTKEKHNGYTKLIRDLRELSDDFTKQIIDNYDNFDTKNKLAKSLGVHNYKVDRALNKLKDGLLPLDIL